MDRWLKLKHIGAETTLSLCIYRRTNQSHTAKMQEGHEEDKDGSGRNPHKKATGEEWEENKTEMKAGPSCPPLISSPSGLRNLGRPACVFFNNTWRHRLFLFHQQPVQLTQL